MAHSRNAGLPDYPEEILSLPMFHPDICCREQAESYVLQHSQGDGSYIVRPNTDNDPSFVSLTISIPGNSACNARVLIEKTSKGFMYFISDKLKFSTFNEVLSFYRDHRIQNKQGIDNLRLNRPLRKINQPIDSASITGSRATISGFDEVQRGLSRPQDITRNKRVMGRTMSESQMSFVQPRMFKHGGSLKDHTKDESRFSVNSQRGMLRERTRSVDYPISDDGNNHLHYANSGSIEQNPKLMVACRPPAPLPRPNTTASDDSFYYTRVQAKKDFFLETYQALKESELCECGLSVAESELALGWTIHQSHDPDTMNNIFFQHGETTTWNMPSDLAYELSQNQISFIQCLCKKGNQPIPPCLQERIDKEMGMRTNLRKSNF